MNEAPNEDKKLLGERAESDPSLEDVVSAEVVDLASAYEGLIDLPKLQYNPATSEGASDDDE